MSIEEIKDIKKLQKMLKYEMELRQYTYKCRKEAGKELEKNSFAWDGKEKNLVVQAMELNERYNKLKATLANIEEIIQQGVKIHDDIIVSKQILQKNQQM